MLPEILTNNIKTETTSVGGSLPVKPFCFLLLTTTPGLVPSFSY